MATPRTPPGEGLWQPLTKAVRADVWTESALAWSPPKRAERDVSVDPLGHSLVVRVPGGAVECVIPLSRCTDVRERPFDDETASGGPLDLAKANPFVSADETAVYIGVAFYKSGVADFKDVDVLSVVLRCDGAADCRQAWLDGLRHLVTLSYPWSPRYVGLDERLTRVFSFVRAHATDGAVPVAALQDQINGHQYDKLVEALGAASSGLLVGRSALAADFFTYDVFRDAVMTHLIVPGVRCWFDELADKDGYLDADAVCKLLTSVQRDPRANEVLNALPTQSTAAAFIKRYAAAGAPEGKMNLEGFVAYLLGVDNDYILPEHRGVFEDMKYPLCAYFCASSHNTFLVAGQVFSSPKVEIYRQVLLSGCRCVEVDIWNGKAADGTDCPIVTHGPVEYTHCKTILFRDVICAIRDAAFVYSEYPVILSFENHCSLTNQQQMAKDIHAILGDLLCTAYMEGDGGTGKTLPSPAQLKRKILIKNKRLKHLVKRADAAGDDVDEATIIRFVLDGDVEEETEEEKERRLSKSKVIAEELSDIVNYVWPVSFKGFDVAFRTDNCYHMSSFNETKAIKYAGAGAEIFSTYCQKQLARVYPKGTRLSSSNFNPMAAWSVGAQLVALNYQTIDAYPMQYNLGMFAPNGTCGYRLKPVCMRGHYYESVPVHRFANYQQFTPLTNVGIEQVVQWDLGVTVLAAPCVGGTAPIISISMGGIPADDTQSKPWELHLRDRRKLVVPHWKARNEFRNDRIIFPDLALLRIAVTDRNSGASLGWECIPVYELQPGYHCVPLRCALSPLAHVLVKIEYSLHSGEHSDIVDKLVNPTEYSSKEAKMQAMAMLNAPDAEGDEEDKDAANAVAAASSPPPAAAAAADATTTSASASTPATPVAASSATAVERRELMRPFVTKLEELARKIKVEASDPDRRGNAFVRSPRPSELMSRELLAEREKGLQSRRKLSLAYDKEIVAALVDFRGEVKRAFQRPVQSAKEMVARLVQAEIDMKQRQLDAWTRTLQRLHKLILDQEQQLGKGRLKRLAEIQATAADNIARKFKEVGSLAIKEGSKLFKQDPTSPANKKDFQAAWSQIEETFIEKSLGPILEDALGTARNVHNEQKRKVEAETKGGILKLREFQERDALVIQNQFESEEKKLLKLMSDEGPQEIEHSSARAYLDALVSKGRLPR